MSIGMRRDFFLIKLNKIKEPMMFKVDSLRVAVNGGFELHF